MRFTIWDGISYILAGPVMVLYIILSKLSFDMAFAELFGHSRLRAKVYDMIQPQRDVTKRILKFAIGEIQ